MASNTNTLTVPGQILNDLAKIQLQEKNFDRVRDRLKMDYTDDKIAKLRIKHMKDPKKARTELQKLADKFVKDYNDFRTRYANMFKTIVETLNATQQGQTFKLKKIGNLMLVIKQRARQYPKRFYFPKKALDEFKKQFDQAMKDLAKQLKVSYAQIKGASRGRKLALGILGTLMKRFKAERMGIQQAKKLTQEALVTEQVAAHIQTELNSGISADFIPLLLQYVTSLERTDKYFKNIKKDIVIMMDTLMDDVRTALRKAAPMIFLLENDPKLNGKIEPARKAFSQQNKQIRAYLNKEANWPRFQLTVAKNLTQEKINMLSTLTNIQKGEVKRAMNDVERRELAA